MRIRIQEAYLFADSCRSGSETLPLTMFYQKTSEVKKIPKTICDFQYNIHSNILKHHREITIVKFQIKTDPWQATDSEVWCTPGSFFIYFFFMTLRCPFKSNKRLTKISILTPRSLTPRWDAHPGAFWEILVTWLHGVMHTAELFKNSNIPTKSNPNSNFFFYKLGTVLVPNLAYKQVEPEPTHRNGSGSSQTRAA